ncbi:hypothetical protein NERG_01008 [Nematocida ausubeli]|uniref:Uncharacterized protein n=1 Tax=Nematocida ausubeli (strain ATCC PRA-371 / ERTm2) TaxID=1913371 RepID=H8ZBQ9_NEMA1|nr:hypothetical protein NERG_01008 [Nematocida ausubeli]
MKLSIQSKTKEVATEDLRTYKIRQEEKERAICRAKIYMLIGVAILCHVWDRVLTVDGLRNVQIKAAAISEETEEGSQGGEKFSVVEITRNIGFMTRKRFLSPEIQLEHSIEVLKKDFKNIETGKEANLNKCKPKDSIYIHTRNISQDRLRNSLPYEGSLLKYKKEYFNTLLELFPSLDGFASIRSENVDSFYAFINSTDIEGHKHKILASLLLLAEGIKVPLKFTKSKNDKKLVLRSANINEDHFRLNMTAFVKTGKEDKKSTDVHKNVLQEKAIDVINFFIESREKTVSKKERSTLQLFFCRNLVDNEFLNSPSFLIQAYIHHCINNTGEMVLFIQTVHDLLNEFIEEKEGASRENRVEKAVKNLLSLYMEDRGAKPEDKQPDNETAAQARNVNAKCNIPKKYISIGKERIYITHLTKKPLYNDSIAHIIDMLRLEPIEDHLLGEESMSSNMSEATYCETALLGLFCSAAYSPNENIYTVDHIESASKELKGFFRKYTCTPIDNVVLKRMHQDWKDVLFGENNQETQYMWIDRKKLMPGLINILYGFSKIAGICDLSKINEIKKRLGDMNIDGSVDGSNKIEKEKKAELENMISAYMTELIKKIALSHDVSVQTSINSKMSFKDGCSDVFGGLEISYTPIDEHDKDLFLTYSYCYEFNICPDYSNANEELKWKTSFKMSIPESIFRKDGYPKTKEELSIIDQIKSYINRSIESSKEIQLQQTNKRKRKKSSNLDEQKQPTLSYASWNKDIDTLLLNLQIYNSEYKRNIVCGLLLYAKEKSLEKTHPFMCLADNILKSSCPAVNGTKSELLMAHILGIADKYYPNILIDMDEYKDMPGCFISALKHVLELASIIKYIPRRTYADAIMYLMIKFRETCLEDSYYSSLESFAKELKKSKGFLLIKILTLNESNTDYITKIVQAMQKTEKEHSVADYEKHSNQFLLWFIWVVKNNNPKNFSTVVESCCDLIDIAETEKINSLSCSSKWGIDIDLSELFEEIKFILYGK